MDKLRDKGVFGNLIEAVKLVGIRSVARTAANMVEGVDWEAAMLSEKGRAKVDPALEAVEVGMGILRDISKDQPLPQELKPRSESRYRGRGYRGSGRGSNSGMSTSHKVLIMGSGGRN